MTTVVSYLAGVPSPHKNPQKLEALTKFIDGVNRCGDRGIVHSGKNIIPCNVAVIQGWVHEKSPNTPHLLLRKQVADTQNRTKGHTVVIDSNLFNYRDKTSNYLRYSFDGVFPDTGIYCDTTPDPVRWQKISQSLNINLKNWRTNGDHILLLLQRNGGWSMGGLDVQDWAVQTIEQLKKYTDRPIIIRAHPGDKDSINYLNSNTGRCKIKFGKRVRLSSNKDLLGDLVNCWAAINYNSSPVVGAAIEGIPIFVTDSVKSQCREIANTELTNIENPLMPDRQPWIERLSMFHWNYNELISGECWQHMKTFI